MGDGKFPVKVIVMLSLHIGCEVVAGDNREGFKNDANGIVDSGPLGYNLGVILVKLTVNFVYITIDCCSKNTQILQVVPQGLSGGDQINRCKPHDHLVHEGSVLHPIEGVVLPVSQQSHFCFH